MDAAITPDSAESDMMNDNVELPVEINTLTIDGTPPAVGDQVDLKVTGNVTRLVNNMAYVRPDTINDSPMPNTPLEPNPMLDEGTRLERLSKTAGGIPGY